MLLQVQTNTVKIMHLINRIGATWSLFQFQDIPSDILEMLTAHVCGPGGNPQSTWSKCKLHTHGDEAWIEPVSHEEQGIDAYHEAIMSPSILTQTLKCLWYLCSLRVPVILSKCSPLNVSIGGTWYGPWYLNVSRFPSLMLNISKISWSVNHRPNVSCVWNWTMALIKHPKYYRTYLGNVHEINLYSGGLWNLFYL